MNSKIKRKIKDSLRFARPYAVPAIRTAYKGSAAVSSMCRHVPFLRRCLNLPSCRVLSVEEWIRDDTAGDSVMDLDPERKNIINNLPKTNEAEVHWLFRKHQVTEVQRTFVASLKGGYAWGYNGGCFFNRNGDLIQNLGKEHWLNYETPYSKTRLRFPHPTEIHGTVAVVAHAEAYATYGHWLFDVSPKFGLLARAGYTPDKVDFYAVGYRQLPYQLEVLERAGISKDKIIPFERGNYLQADTLLVPFLSSYWYSTHQRNTLDYVRWLGRLNAQKTPPTRMLFISRADAAFRRLNQESELMPQLERLGFEFVNLKGLTIEDTAHIFSQAKIVVAPYGSGLMNIVFCFPGTKVLEIVGPTCLHNFHWHLSEECGLDHHYYMGIGEPLPCGSELLDLTNDINVDSSKLLDYIKQMVVD